MQLAPTDTRTLARAVADTIVAATDPVSQGSGIFYAAMARPWRDPVLDAVRVVRNDRVRITGAALIDDPADVGLHLSLQHALVDAADDDDVSALFELAWVAEERSRVGVHVGPLYERDHPLVTPDRMIAEPVVPVTESTDNAEVLIVITFRERDMTGRHRLRNLLACLRSLRDQSYRRTGYRVVVVECDDQPRWRHLIEPLCDRYLFAEKASLFNRSWAVNVGVLHGGGAPEVVCVLDADVLTDRDFVARNAERFLAAGRGGWLPHRNMFCLDAPATSWAIAERLFDHAPIPAEDHLRGFHLRKSPGCCLWARTEVFLRVGGMDERYEGWGGEDNDIFGRLDIVTPMDHFDDQLLHMYHPPSSLLKDDGTLINAHIPPLSWQPEEPIGEIGRFAGQPVPVS